MILHYRHFTLPLMTGGGVVPHNILDKYITTLT